MPENNRTVTVVIPTYKRAHLLKQTIPSYLQPEVLQLVLVDDCSPDNTAEVAKDLIRHDSRITYIRNITNSKQTASKNRGKALATTDYVYFGDDDSILSEGAISQLIETAEKTSSHVVGASALYLKDDEDSISSALSRRKNVSSAREIVDLHRLQFNFSVTTSTPIELPVCQASFLIRTSEAKLIDFDEHYIGNCYREETDYLIRCKQKGLKIIYESRAIQTNLPPSKATGGARGRSRLLYEAYALYNTLRFVLKNKAILRKIDVRCRPTTMILNYVEGRFQSVIARLRTSNEQKG